MVSIAYLSEMPRLIISLLGASIGIMFTISPLWIGESCRPELRGFFLCFFNTSIVLGQFFMQVKLPSTQATLLTDSVWLLPTAPATSTENGNGGRS